MTSPSRSTSSPLESNPACSLSTWTPPSNTAPPESVSGSGPATTDEPILFADRGEPWPIHRLTYRRANHGDLQVRGYEVEGTATTPFDRPVRNDLDRFHLFADAMDRVEKLALIAAYAKQWSRENRIEHRQWIIEHGEDMPEIVEWRWPD